MKSPLQLTGFGLRPQHYDEFLASRPAVAWVEVHSENFFAEGGKPLHKLDQVAEHYPVSLHGLSLSLGSADDLNWRYLKKLKELVARVKPCLVSDHLAWSSIDGRYLHDLLPMPYTDEALMHMATRIQQVQDYLQRQILIENITSYVRWDESVMPEWDFLTAVAKEAGCGILLDVSNVYINSFNLGFNAQTYIKAIPSDLVQEIHLGGFSTMPINHNDVLVDTHDAPVVSGVWDLYYFTIQQFGTKATIVEWDEKLPGLDRLYLEAFRAEKIMREAYVASKQSI